jgi:predicted nucleotidyltransferase
MNPPDALLAEYVAGFRDRDRARARRDRERRERLQAALPAVVRRLVREFGVTRVLLFGSLARGEAGLESDVDLLVEGLPAERLFEATAMLSRELDADVDLVLRAAARPAVLDRALSEGHVLHG